MSALWLTDLDPPALSSDADQRGQRHRPGHPAVVVGQLAGALVAADHEPVLACLPGGDGAVVVQAQERPVVGAAGQGGIRRRIECAMVIPMVIQTIGLDPSGAVWTERYWARRETIRPTVHPT